ncbi:MAG: TetR/AcrR family transcriptional regulator [Candidatus Accumulibacter sp.]|jgi:AcrR family transcriptional regulator|nr:TetR/AcrR family transcriptional regulator [Accumulibacter sp.]
MARRSEHSRDEIRRMALDAAERIVAAKGYGGLSARKVATAIGYTVGTLYLVFENLDDLVLRINGRTLDQLHARLEATTPPNDRRDPERTLLALADAYIAYAEAESPRWNMLFEYVAGKGGPLPEWYLHKLGRVFGLVETALRPLACDDHEARRTARVLWAGVQGICTLKIHQRMDLAGGQRAEEMADTLIRNFLRGLATERPPGARGRGVPANRNPAT